MSKFKCEEKHPRWRSDEKILKKLKTYNIGDLELTGRIEKRFRSRRYCEVFCYHCKKSHWILVDNILAKKTTNCKCQRGRKYHAPPEVVKTLGQRYDAIVQRCTRDTHCSSPNYKGRGIKNNFQSREHFIKWALQKYQISDFKDMDFDRIDNDGHYEPENLRLVSRSVNNRNTRRSIKNRKKKKRLE